MSVRGLVVVLFALAAGACPIDNPSWAVSDGAGGTSGASGTSAGSSSGGSTSGAGSGSASDSMSGGSGSTSGSSGSMTASATGSGTTDPGTSLSGTGVDTVSTSGSSGGSSTGGDECGGECSECQVCAGGVCQPLVMGSPCSGELECASVVVKKVEGGELVKCYAGGGEVLTGACDGAGECVAPTFNLCSVAATPFQTCSTTCQKANAGKCQPGTAKSEVNAETMCVVEGMTDGCKPSCTGDFLSVDNKSCVQGLCKASIQMCVAYKCANAGCLESCVDDGQCQVGHLCINQKCI